jgi:hypothetical protein
VVVEGGHTYPEAFTLQPGKSVDQRPDAQEILRAIQVLTNLAA